ncbi:MAG: FAD-dependent oxidoreductase [Clostridia bacterium]|nr:FAD-dependent oxidoreductase [Clostridia bacterium]
MQATFEIRNELYADVVVCGGGVAGISAAVSAAKSGAVTLLIESGGYLGGTATKGMVGPFMTCLDAKGENQIIRGFFSEFVNRMIADGGAVSYNDCPGGDSWSGYRLAGHIGVTPFDTECLKRTADRLCVESGVNLLCHTTLIGCETDGRRITAIYTADGEGIDKIRAKVFIDCTGNASLAAKAGAATFRGDGDGFMQTASMFFIIDGVDRDALDAHMAEHTEMRERFYMDAIEAGRADGRFPCGTMKLRIYENPNGTWTVNMAQSDDPLNELSAADITTVEIAQREQIQKLIAFLREEIPPLRNIRLVATASDMGIRESRRIVGRHLFCLEDITSAVKFDDRIAVCANSIDIHQKVGVAYTAYKSGSNYYIPLSCLIPKDMDNLLAAGKCLSADKYAFAAVRVMPPCFAMGEAVGITAAMAAAKGVNVPDVPVCSVQEEIVRRGGYIG